MSSPLKSPTALTPLASHITNARSAKLPAPPPLPAVTRFTASKKDPQSGPERKPRDVPGRRPVGKATDDVKVKVGLSLPVSAITRLRSTATGQGLPQAEVLLLAVDAYAQDPNRGEPSVHMSTTPVGFIIEATRVDDEVRSVLAVRISKHNLERLDSLVVSLGAANRSDLVARALLK